MRRMSSRWAAPALALAALLAHPAHATPVDRLSAGDPLEAELRVLDALDPGPLAGHLRLAHLGTRPSRVADLLGGAAVARESLGVARWIGVVRLERALARDAAPGTAFAGPGAARPTPRLFERGDAAAGGRVEVSAGLEATFAEPRPRRPRTDDPLPGWSSGSGLHVRAAVALDRWLASAHLLAGYVRDARTFADPIVGGTDLVAHTDDTWLAYDGAHGWAARAGRSRWAWGPGAEGSLLLSATMPAITGLELAVPLPVLRARATVLNATLGASAGEQLAAHRIEWSSARGGLRVGVSEAARYQGRGWRPLYAVGILPYVLAQRLEVADEPGAGAALRNNVLLGADVSWRVAEGTRVYGELLADDLHARTASVPNKLAWQAGLDGVGVVGTSRVTWNGEFTRVSRWVYTSFFGRTHAARGEPLGFPTGPDARRVRVRIAWDPGPDWQVSVTAARTDRGESGLDQPFVPGSGMDPSRPFDFLGERERTREAGATLRWWPAGGVDVAVSAGWSRVEGLLHVPGRERSGWRGSAALRLAR
jgi:hypothetical protein